MYRKKCKTHPLRQALLATLATLGTLGVLSDAHAYSSVLSNWQSRYPSSSASDNLADRCTLCHASSNRSQFNAYGWALRQNGRDFAAIEALNSDADPTGSSNLEEINANTQPGWTTGANNVINGGSVSSNALPPAGTSGDLDPAASNQPPTADANGPYSGTQGIPVAFDGSGSSDADGSIVSYSWDFGDGSSGNGATQSHTYQNTGTYTVTLNVTDDAGDSDTATTSATIGAGNQPPVADPKGPYTGTAGTEIAFDGSGSSDPDGSIVSYTWDFGDGATGSGATTNHVYAAQGTYNLSLTVTDDGGAVDSASTSVSIDPANQAPTANAGGPYTATDGTTVVFDGTGSSDADGTITDYAWDFGDGTSGSGATPSHLYAAAGSYNVLLTVTDDGGLTHIDTTSATIGEVVNQPPVADANGPYSGTTGMLISFDSNGSTDPDGSIVTFSWDFGDGTSATGATASHAYTAEGSYNVTLTVTDNDGAMDSASTTVTVGSGNLAPVADAGGPYSSMAGVEIQFDGSGSNDPDGSIVAYKWEFGDGSESTDLNPTHSYATAGTYNVTLTVYDDNGAMDADAASVEVTAVTTGADVYLSELWVSDSLRARVGRRVRQSIIALGSGTEVTQRARVSLAVTAPSGIAVSIPDDSVSRRIRPGRGARQFEFDTSIRCEAAGSYTLVWTATISADQNSDLLNDSLSEETTVTCSGGSSHDDGDNSERNSSSDDD
jgi:PKD repeat protein